MSEPGPLELATDDELLDELSKRFKASVFMTMKERGSLDRKSDGLETFTLNWNGGFTLCYGLVTRAQGRMYHHLCDESRPGASGKGSAEFEGS